MKIILLISFFVLSLLLFSFSVTIDFKSNDLKKCIEKSDYIFTGNIISSRKIQLIDSIQNRYLIREKGKSAINITEYSVLRKVNYKGVLDEDTVKLYSYTFKSEGGISLELNKTYIILGIKFNHRILDSDVSFYEPRLDVNAFWTDKSYGTSSATDYKIKKLIDNL